MDAVIAQGSPLARQIAADLADLRQPIPAHNDAAPGAPSFSQAFQRALADVSHQDQIAAKQMADVDSGRSDDLVGAMLASQQASLSFSMLMQVRNRVVGAVDDLLKLPV